MKKFNNMKLYQKILIIILSASFIAQFFMGILAFVSIFNISNYSQKQIKSLSLSCSEKGQIALKNQAKSYLCDVADGFSEASDNILEEISDEVASFSEYISDIYMHEKNFIGHDINFSKNNNSNDRIKACEKIYAIDYSNSNAEKDIFLTYDLGYKNNNIYKTDINSWSDLDSSERDKIQNNNIVVSKNVIPENIKKEMRLLSNFLYSAKSVYNSNVAISSVYVGTKSGILYKYDSKNLNSNYDPCQREWYKDAVNFYRNGENLPVWQSTYTSKSDSKLCITCSKAIVGSNGDILGVVAIDMYLDEINKYILNNNAGNTGYAFVVDKNSKIIMHPNYTEENFNDNLENIDESYKNLLCNMALNGQGIDEAVIDGKNYYVSYNSLKTPGWSIGIASEVDKIIEPSEEMKNYINSVYDETNSRIKKNLFSIYILFLAIFIACSMILYFIGVNFTDKILGPIKLLCEKAKLIGKGNFDIKLPVKSDDELGKLSGIFNQMAEDLKTYMENLKITTAEKEKIHSELMIARKIQRSMLPCIFPAFPDRNDFDIYAIMDPAKEVGGDFYDFFFIDKTHFAVVIADVSDKGVSAALFMVIAKILIKNQLQNGDSPAKVLEIVNKRLCENNDAGMFVTAFIGVIDITTGETTVANAGHNPPLVYKKVLDKYDFMNFDHGFVLGGVQNQTYKEKTINLSKNDILFLYTDGVTESTNKNGNQFSDSKLKEFLNSEEIKNLSIQEVITKLRDNLEKFSDGIDRTDDITVLAFENLEIFGENNEREVNI